MRVTGVGEGSATGGRPRGGTLGSLDIDIDSQKFIWNPLVSVLNGPSRRRGAAGFHRLKPHAADPSKMASWLHRCLAVWLPGCRAAWPQGGRKPSHGTLRIPGCGSQVSPQGGRKRSRGRILRIQAREVVFIYLLKEMKFFTGGGTDPPRGGPDPP